LLRRERQACGRLRLCSGFSVVVGAPEIERAFLAFHVVVADAPREVRGPHHPRERLQPNDRADTLRLGCGKHHVRSTGFIDASEDRALRSNFVQDEAQITHSRLQVGCGHVTARKSCAAAVIKDEPEGGGKGPQQRTGQWPFPRQFDLAWGFDFTGNVDLAWEWPLTGPLLRALASSFRLILHDRRGTGLSSRNVAAPNLETRVSDLRLVLDEVGSQCPVLGGINEAGAPNVMLAATEPQRVRSIVWLEPFPRVVWAPDFPWGVSDNYVEREERSLDLWGTNQYGEAWAEAEAAAGLALSPEQRLMAGVMSRHTATPDMARELDHIWYETDVRAVLPSVQAPTLLVPRKRYPRKVDVATYMASLIPHATVTPVSGDFGPDDIDEVVGVLHPFLGLEPRPPELETVLATVLFTDIVGSTEKQA